MTTNNDSIIPSLQQSYTSAVYDKDPDALLALYDPAARVFDTWAVWSYESTASRGKSIRNWLCSLDAAERVKVQFDDTRIIPAGDVICATAVVTYAAVDPSGQVLRSMQNRLTWIVAITGPRALIVHEHTSVPIDDGMKPMMRRV
jgi:ketosteroid isomerase-like protein